jgi:hypothetical protein
VEVAVVTGIVDPTPPIPSISEWPTYIETDDFALDVIAKLQTLEEHERPMRIRRYEYRDNLLYHEKTKLYVPDALRGPLLACYHDSLLNGGHSGAFRTTVNILADDYYWPTLEKDVNHYVKTCPQCQRFRRPLRQAGLLRSLPAPATRWDTIGFDLFSMPETNVWGGRQRNAAPPTRAKRTRATPVRAKEDDPLVANDNTNDNDNARDDEPRTHPYLNAVLCIVDYHSGSVILEPTVMTCSAVDLAHMFIRRLFSQNGVPKTIISDREPRALSAFFSTFTKLLNITHGIATARHQQTDGKCERKIKDVKNLLKPYLDVTGTNWVDMLPILEFRLNDSRMQGLDLSPFEINLLRRPTLTVPADRVTDPRLTRLERTQLQKLISTANDVGVLVQHRLQRQQDAQATQYDKTKRPQRFAEGEKVLLDRDGIDVAFLKKPTKLAQTYVGPFTIKRVEPNGHPDTYELDLPLQLKGLHPVFHTRLLRKWHEPTSTRYRTVEPPPPTVEIEGETEYVIERILRQRTHQRRTQYLVKWQGYNDEDATWESADTLADTTALYEWQQLQQSQQSRKRKRRT